MNREKLGSRLGFILLSAGCAIGIGNVWKFPWMTGQYGGGIFVLIYLFFLILLGVPVMTMEFAMGRAAQKSPVRLYDELEPKGSKWHWHGYAAFAGNIILMMFYTNVAGWMLNYFVKTARGDFIGASPDEVGEIFNGMLGNPATMIMFTAFVVALGFTVCSAGVKRGLERITKFMMLALLAIMVVLAINSVFMEGGSEGLKFYLMPSLSKMREVGIANVIVGAMNQAFFTLSLGIGAMAIFGSYIGRERALTGESINIAVLDTFVAIVSGLIIFPACSAYNIDVTSGPSLIFVTLPNVFENIPLGRLWGSLFFIFMSFAALSTVLAVFENIISCIMDMTGWTRKKTCLISGIAMFVLSLPCALGFSVWSNVTPFGEGSGIMDLEDFAVSNILLPLGSLIYVLFCTTRYGWGKKAFIKEANAGKGIKLPEKGFAAAALNLYMTYVLPVIITAIFVIGIVQFFK